MKRHAIILPLLLLAAPALAQEPKSSIPDLHELVAKPQSELYFVEQRFHADLGNLMRAYSIPGSPTRLARLRQFYSDWRAAVGKLDKERFSADGKAEWAKLKEQIERELRALARRQTGCRALMDKLYGIGELSSLVTLCELGDVSRLHASRQAVRLAGIDIGVHRSDRTARLGKLTRQGSAELRWALYEAAQSACRPTSPDYQDYHALKDRGLSHTRASLTIARKLARRSYHVLRELGPAALEPITD